LIKKHDIGRPVYKVQALKIAEELGNKIVTNIVMVGAFTSIFDLLGKEAVRDAVIDSVPKKFTDLNIKAFERGYEAGKNALKKL
jgi:2-oxoglutarate ferredoxin oxidoreductase subunit gamma